MVVLFVGSTYLVDYGINCQNTNNKTGVCYPSFETHTHATLRVIFAEKGTISGIFFKKKKDNSLQLCGCLHVEHLKFLKNQCIFWNILFAGQEMGSISRDFLVKK